MARILPVKLRSLHSNSAQNTGGHILSVFISPATVREQQLTRKIDQDIGLKISTISGLRSQNNGSTKPSHFKLDHGAKINQLMDKAADQF